jgi:hypothetical protein
MKLYAEGVTAHSPGLNAQRSTLGQASHPPETIPRSGYITPRTRQMM